ncbi:MAG: sensor histidine kinase [Agathobacter sp.]
MNRKCTYLKDKKHRLTIRRQLIAITFSFTVFIGIVITAASYFIYHRYLEENLIESTDTSLLFLSDYIDNELSNVDDLISFCQSNTDINRFIDSNSSNPDTNRLNAFDTLFEYCQSGNSSYWLRVVILNLTENYIQIVSPTYSSTANVAVLLPMQDYYEEMTQDGYLNYKVGFVKDPFYTGHDRFVLPLLKPITYKFNSNLGGYIYVEITDTLFLDAFRNMDYGNDSLLILTMGEKNYLYSNEALTILDDSFPSQIVGNDEITDSNGNHYLVISEPLSHDGIYVSQLLSDRQLNAGLSIFYILMVLLFIILFIIGVLLYMFLGKTINAPVRRIQEKLVAISEGDFTRDTSIEWNHELGDIGKGVNDLAENIDQLIESSIIDERQKKDLEYKVLQTQVNPHFLYNTLNSIKWMAQIQGANGIMEMTTSLSRLLKSISKGTKLLIPLQEELDLLKDYFTIQQYRYGGTIRLDILSEEEALNDCAILKFTLQPLVENAIFHGIEPTGEPGIVTVHIYSVSDMDMQIDITDNGVGMDENTITRILADNSVNKSDFFKELGVSNVHKRLQYEFGDNYGITIKSEKGCYTTMSIHMPKRRFSSEDSNV